jgi:hypothetical protein
MLAERVLVPVILGNVLGFATVVAWCAVPAAQPVDLVAVVPVAAPITTLTAHVPHVIAGPDLADQLTLDAARLAFVVDIAGEPYAQLDAYSVEQMPRHGRVRRTTSTTQPDQQVVFAPIARQDVPAPWRDWIGHELVVDGSCRARIDGFALRAGQSGEQVEEQMARSLDEFLESAGPALVAHLDGCRGGKTARDASLPAPVAAVADPGAGDAALIRLATADMFVSPSGQRDIALRVAAPQQDGSVAMATTAVVVVHPVTHTRYVIVHASMPEPMCGGPEGFDLTGVYIDAGNGDLSRQWVGNTALDLSQPLVDLDNDGSFEAVGDRTVTSLRGTELSARLGDQWIGCPC